MPLFINYTKVKQSNLIPNFRDKQLYLKTYKNDIPNLYKSTAYIIFINGRPYSLYYYYAAVTLYSLSAQYNRIPLKSRNSLNPLLKSRFSQS